MLGLEYSASELVGNLRAAAPAGVIDAVLNALPGAGFAFLLGWGWEVALVLAGVTLIGGAKALAVAVVTVIAVLVVAIRYGRAISRAMSVQDPEALLLSV